MLSLEAPIREKDGVSIIAQENAPVIMQRMGRTLVVEHLKDVKKNRGVRKRRKVRD